MISNNRKSFGFTLVEMAIVLTIVGLLVGAGFSSLGAFMDNAKQSHTQGNLLVTKQALLNYVKVNKHMPCPDTDGDGAEDRTGALSTQCSDYVGTVPYDDIGLARAVTSDDYSNLFGYAVHKEANDVAVMGLNVASSTDEAALLNQPGAYFYNLNAPAFDLETPPTAHPTEGVDDPTESYAICKKYAADDCSGADDVEVNFIPAVIVAFNENGGETDLDTCTGSWSTRESQNCNTTTELNPTFVKGVFSDGEYDDQMVVISAYEIKAQALGDFKDPPTASDDYDSEYAGYQLIVRDDVSNANVTNVSTQGDDSLYIDTNDDGDGGNVDITNLNMDAGDDKLHVVKDISAGAGVNMGRGNDEVYIGGLVIGVLDLGRGDDEAVLVGGIHADGRFDAGENDDLVTVKGGVIDGILLLGNEPDELVLLDGVTIGASAYVVGGDGIDILQVDVLQAAFDPTTLARVWGFETLIFSDNETVDIQTEYGAYLPNDADLPSNL